MTAPKPVAVLVLSLAVLMLGLAALFADQSGIAPLFLRMQDDVWRALGAADTTRPDWAKFAEMAFLAIAGSGTILLILRTRIYLAGAFVLAVLAATFFLALLYARTQGDALDMLGPGAGLLLVFVTGAAARIGQIRALKRDLRQAFANSLPRAAIDRMNTPGSSAIDSMRIRSPSSAPPVNGDVGSTATMPTVKPASR